MYAISTGWRPENSRFFRLQRSPPRREDEEGSGGHLEPAPPHRLEAEREAEIIVAEAERDAALGAIKGPEVTRFKGLGEISPKEFGQFIGDGIRLVQVSVGSMGEVEKSLDFFMGKNTPARKDFIVENVGTAVRMASVPARQNTRIRRSMASLLPRVTSSCSGRQPKRSAKRALSR